MVNREKEGFVSEYGHWPTISIPCPVEDYFWKLVKRESAIRATQVERGYHNAGWAYIEVEIQARSFTIAEDKAGEIYTRCMWKFQDI